MKEFCVALSLLVSSSAASQPLRDINYEYLYNPEASLTFDLKPIRGVESFTLVYSLQPKDTTGLDSDYLVQWEGREMLSDREGIALQPANAFSTRTAHGLEGRVTIDMAHAPRFAVARVTKKSMNRAWLFYTELNPNYPINNFIVQNGSAVLQSYVRTNVPVTLGYDSSSWIVSYYNDNFPAAAPPFSETQTRVAARMDVDSVFTWNGHDPIDFPRKGLYLLQKDTTAVQGLAIRAEDDYPQYSRLASLPDPLMYISTRQENERLQASRGNKKTFDRIILGIANDTERARILMRNYFRRVELANRYFTSYKEGWKTDRGMIYIIFGKPDEVYRFNDREIWNYKNERLDMQLTFTAASSLFDPDNFVLIREKKLEDEWYETIDLWRNARF
jgi:GWxTD domain-containing protein